MPRHPLIANATPTAPEVPNPYEGSIRLYNDGDVGGLRRENALLKTLLLGAGFAVVVLALALAYIHSVPAQIGVMNFDRDGRNVTAYGVTPITMADSKTHDVIASYYIPLVLESLFNVSSDVDADKRNLQRFVRPFIKSGSPAENTIGGYLAQYDPVLRGQSEKVEIQVNPMPVDQPHKLNEYNVSWTAVTKAGARSTSGVYTATVRVEWGTPQPDFQRTSDGLTLGGNPVGIYITDLNVNQSLDPRRTATGATP
jgi:type IV secretory pathway TrbF-like protein